MRSLVSFTTLHVATLLRSLVSFTTLHVATLLRSLGSVTTLHVATLLRSLGSFTTLHVATLLRSLVSFTTLHVATLLTSLVSLTTWHVATLLRSLGSFTTLHVATLLRSLGSFTTLHVATLLRSLVSFTTLHVATLLRSLVSLTTWHVATLLRSLGSFTTLHVATLLRSLARSESHGKPPPESYARIQRAGALNFLMSKLNGQKTVLMTDGAKCYSRIASECDVMLAQVSHSQGSFVKKVTRNRQNLSCHTGTIDSMWNLMKKSIPSNLSAKSGLLMVYARAWQWRCIHKNADCQLFTTHALQRWRWKTKKRAPSFSRMSNHQISTALW